MNGEAEKQDRSRTPSPLSRSSSRSSIGQSPARTTLLKRNQSLSAKQIRFYRNGDRYFGGLKLAVSTERYKEFFALLVELSNKLDLKTGAVRYIFDAETGRPVTDVSQLNTSSSYVCSSSSSFKEIEGGYGQTQAKSWSTGASKDRHELTNWNKSTPRMDPKRDFIKPKLVTVVKNGKPPQKKVTMLLNKKTALDLNQVLDHLSSKGTLGKVDRLCCLDGREIKELKDLFDEDMIFIAFTSNERFPEEGFDVDVQSSKYWKTSVRPSRTPYPPSLRNELNFSWKDLPRARCLACALKALTAVNTPSPQSQPRPRPKSAPPRLSYRGQKSRRSDPGPSSKSAARNFQPKPSRSPRISSARVKGEPGAGPKSTGKKSLCGRPDPKTPSPKPSTSAKKTLSFSPETKDQETTDSPPKPKGIRGGGRRRKAQLALLNGEEINADDPRHAYYVLIHDEMSGKPTASVKPMVSSDKEFVSTVEIGGSGAMEAAENKDVEANGTKNVTSANEVKKVKNVTYVVSNGESASFVEVKDDSINEVASQSNGSSNPEEPKVVQKAEEKNSVTSDEKPGRNSAISLEVSPRNVDDEKPSERDWSKPKPIRGRRKKAKADMNGNEPSQPEEKPQAVENHAEANHGDTVNGLNEVVNNKLLLTNGDS